MADRPKVWITRTQSGATKSAKAFWDAGYHPIISPLLRITPAVDRPPMPSRDAVLIITSQNAMKVLTEVTSDRSWPVVCVGNATARLAKEAGFLNVVSADGASEDVTRIILNTPSWQGRPFIHIAGQEVRGSIVEDLQRAGLQAQRHIYYLSEPVQTWPDVDISNLVAVALYSPKGAEALRRPEPDLRHVMAISLSPAIDAALGDLAVKSRHVAVRPNEAALIRALDKAL